MGKIRKSNRETKKEPAFSPKEKKANKLIKKQESESTPFILPK